MVYGLTLVAHMIFIKLHVFVMWVPMICCEDDRICVGYASR